MWKSRLLTLATCVFVLAVGGVTESVAPCLRHISLAFYSTAGAVAPLIGLGLFVEIVLVMRPAIASEGATEVKMAGARTLVRTNALLLILSEAAALYAIGAKASNGFLMVCVVLPWVLQILLLIDTAYHRLGINRIRF